MQRKWRGVGQRGVVIVHNSVDEVKKPLTLAVIEPSSGSLTLLPLGPEKSVSTALEHGLYPTQALVGLGQLEKLDWSFLLTTLSLEYGVVLDGVIWSSESQVVSVADVRDAAWTALRPGAQTTLPFWDRISFWLLAQRISDYRVNTDFDPEWSSDIFDRWAGKELQDPQIRGSGLTLAIQNGSGIPGLATRFSRSLKLMGYDVRSVETVDTRKTSELVLGDVGKKNTTQLWAQNRLRALFSELSVRNNPDLLTDTRSDGVVIFGTDWREQFTRLRQ